MDSYSPFLVLLVLVSVKNKWCKGHDRWYNLSVVVRLREVTAIETFCVSWYVASTAWNVDGDSKLLCMCLWTRLDYT